MSIQSTMDITRDRAIERIKEIDRLAREKDYSGIEVTTTENRNVSIFVDEYSNPDLEHIEKWTSKMIENLIDQPFFRWSMFDNYIILDD